MDQVLRGRSLCDEALAYARRGWPVFPCSADDKRPLVGESAPGAGDAGLYRATCNAAEIRAWWQRWPDAMIAVATGAPIGAFVVDLDPKGSIAAEELLEQLRLRCGGKLPQCPMAHTPRGGLHLYYAMPTGVEIGNRINILGASKGGAMIDIRGTGGYVILPPSTRRGPKAVKEGCDRVPYRWQENARFGDLPIPDAPAALVLLTVSRDREEAKPIILSDRAPVDPSAGRAKPAGDRERRYALAAFDDEIRKVQNAGNGMRNNALNNAALKLGLSIGAGE